MIRRQRLIRTAFTAVAASFAIAACDSSSAPSPTDPSGASGTQGGPTELGSPASAPRHGELHLTKSCPVYTGQPGSYCTITSSNLASIPAGTNVIYTSAKGETALSTDIVLDTPGPGNNAAFGHVELNLVTRHGVVTLNGGTGKFRGIQANAEVTFLGGGPNWAWDGTFSFEDNGNH
jgi:hypothetical protein